MRSHFGSRVMAALLVVIAWLVSLLSGTGPVQGAPNTAATAVTAPSNGFCESRLEEKVLQYLLRQTRNEQARIAQEREEERQAQTVLLAHKRQTVQERTVRDVEGSRIEDLVPQQYQPLVLDVAERFELDPRLVAAVGTVESQWYERALGTHGDSGLMQILPSTAEWIAGRIGLHSYDLYDPMTNLTMGAWYLKVLYAEYGNWPQALAVYNGGPRAAPGGEENPYSQQVLRVFKEQEF